LRIRPLDSIEAPAARSLRSSILSRLASVLLRFHF
jgi:hypothetical protein